mmetsp:Transcript_23975/g.52458  ORF Transcript_23975/g.52458 Transcript_23975/m.52458 type:complete len:574 (-) Transcript_23975:376-2097(-)
MSEAERPAKRLKEATPAAFIDDAAEVIQFHMLESTTKEQLEQEIERGGIEFNGEFFHQHFGEEEKIKGYLDLQIDVWFSGHTYHTWIDMKWAKKKPGADKLAAIFKEHFPAACKSKEEMIESIVSTLNTKVDISKSEVVASVPTTSSGSVLITRQRIAVCQENALDKEMAEYIRAVHDRLEPLLLFFVDGVSRIDNDDPKWELLLAVRQKDNLVMGMQTCYNFWAFPDRKLCKRPASSTPGAAVARAEGAPGQERDEAAAVGPRDELEALQLYDVEDVQSFKRLRLSQVLVMPPFQGLGLGKKMLQIAYQMAVDRGCIDLTVEDPSPNMQRMREKTEVEMMASTSWVQQQADRCVQAALQGQTSWPAASPVQVEASGEAAAPSAAAGPLVAGAEAALTPPASFWTRLTAGLKIHKREARMVWEALLYAQPGLLEDAHGKAAVTKLVELRLEASNFAYDGSNAETKKVVDLNKSGSNFIMMRAKVTPEEASASSSAGPAAATGRINVVTYTAEQKAERMQELMDERLGQLDTMRSLLARSHSSFSTTSKQKVDVGAGGKAASGPATAHVLVEAV